jgi:hypothetical protein
VGRMRGSLRLVGVQKADQKSRQCSPGGRSGVTAAAEEAARSRGQLARDRFARTFADVLSGRYGGRWVVEWERPDRPALSSDGDGRTVPGEE